MKKTALLFAALLALHGCTLRGIIKDTEQLTPEQQTYLETIEKLPLRFDISKDAANDAWGRAQVFIAHHSGMKIQTSTDYVLETYNPVFEPGVIDLGSVTYAYHVSRSPVGDKFQFVVSCTGPYHSMKNDQIKKTADRNARIMAQYISTGKMEHPELIIK